MTDPAPAPATTATPPAGITSPLAYPEVSEPVYAVLRDLRERGSARHVEENAVVWRCIAAAFEGARAAGLLAETPPPPPRRIRRALLLRRRRGEVRAP